MAISPAHFSDSEMIKAIQQRDKSYDGKFFYGVITTGVFCLPSCPSKAAKPENIRLLLTLDVAMSAGFRPCKRCQPVKGDLKVQKMIEVVRYIEANFEQKIILSQLGEVASLSPSRLQKIFKNTFGISPKTYQDAIRLQCFKDALKKGTGVTDAIYGAGYGSISRVYGESSRQIGMAPKAYRAGGKGEVIYYATRQTKLGFMLMAATDKGVCYVSLNDEKSALTSQLSDEFPQATLYLSTAQKSTELDDWMLLLDQHINLHAPRPDLPLDIKGTAFQIKVWQFLLSIKEGEVFSYGDLAQRIGSPKAARAVGTACGKNKIAVLIPCHRVLKGDGGLGGYRWGLERKKALLEQEKAMHQNNGS